MSVPTMSAGQQIGRELDAMELGLHRRRERADGQRLGQAGHAFEQDVAVGEQADEQPVHELFLADDDVGDFLAQFADPVGGGLHFFVQRYAHVRGNLEREGALTQVIQGQRHGLQRITTNPRRWAAARNAEHQPRPAQRTCSSDPSAPRYADFSAGKSSSVRARTLK